MQRLVVDDVGPVRSKEVINRPRRMIAAVLAAFMLALWCAGSTLVDGSCDVAAPAAGGSPRPGGSTQRG